MKAIRCVVFGTAAWMAAVSVASCGSDEPTSEGPIEPACAQVAAAHCSLLERCALVLLRLEFGSRDACEAQMEAQCLNTASLPGAALKASAVSACASSLSASTCELFQARVDRPYCDDAGGGTLGEGAPCTNGYQCASRACFPGADGVCGTCQAPIAVGGGCHTSLDCPNGTTCSGHLCLEASGVGGPCDATHGCGGYLVCLQGVCQLSGAQDDPCQAGSCSNKLGLDCNAASQTCQSVTVRAEGEDCDWQVACEAHGACVQGKCKSAVPDGRPCDATAGPFCQLPAQCIAGWCKTPDATTCNR